MEKRQLERKILPLVLREVPLRMMEVFGVTCPQAPTTQIIEVDDD